MSDNPNLTSNTAYEASNEKLDTTGCPEGGGYMYTVSGRWVNVLDPKPQQIHIEDIAYALAQQPRYGGHTSPVINVAQHSCLVHDYVNHHVRQTNNTTDCFTGMENDEISFSALMHDAEEAYLIDIPRPLKKLVPEYVRIGDNFRKAIFKKYSCIDTPEVWKTIKFFDNVLLRIEAANGSYRAGDDWGFPAEFEKYRDDPFEAWDPDYSESEFLQRFKKYRKVESNEQ